MTIIAMAHQTSVERYIHKKCNHRKQQHDTSVQVWHI